VDVIRFTILGQPASKANSRQLVTQGGKPRFIKSEAARQFMDDARRQIPAAARRRLQGPVAVRLRMFYASERPDLDESVLLDALQDVYATQRLRDGTKRRHLVQAGVYCNDRQVRAKVVLHSIDKRNPRVEVEVISIAPTDDLFADQAFRLPTPF
jgi:Holliday junction resolvase RusA-like endonuclease